MAPLPRVILGIPSIHPERTPSTGAIAPIERENAPFDSGVRGLAPALRVLEVGQGAVRGVRVGGAAGARRCLGESRRGEALLGREPPAGRVPDSTMPRAQYRAPGASLTTDSGERTCVG